MREDGLPGRLGCVAERDRDGMTLEGVETPFRINGKPARGSAVGDVKGLSSLVGRGDTTGRGVEGKSFTGVSGGGVRSARHRSGGVDTLSRSSSDSDGVACGSDKEGAEESTEGADI